MQHNHKQLLSFLMNVSFLITFLLLLLIAHTWLCVTFISRAIQQFYLCCCAPLHQLLSAWAHPVLACCRAKCTTPPVPAESLMFLLPRTPSVWPIYRDAQWSQGCSGVWLENITLCFYYSCPVDPHPTARNTLYIHWKLLNGKSGYFNITNFPLAMNLFSITTLLLFVELALSKVKLVVHLPWLTSAREGLVLRFCCAFLARSVCLSSFPTSGSDMVTERIRQKLASCCWSKLWTSPDKLGIHSNWIISCYEPLLNTIRY